MSLHLTGESASSKPAKSIATPKRTNDVCYKTGRLKATDRVFYRQSYLLTAQRRNFRTADSSRRRATCRMLLRNPGALQADGDPPETVQRGLQAFDDLGGDLVGRRQQVGIVEAASLSQKMSRLTLSRLSEVGIGEAPEALGLLALVRVGRRCSRRRNRRGRRASSAALSA